MKKSVLFVCIENSCRSQMAEGFAKHLGKDILDAWSAGSNPSGQVNPNAALFMKEKKIDLETHKSKGLHDVPQHTWDFVITMGCGDTCPFVDTRNREDWALPDPKNLPPSEFRKVRDEIETRIKNLLQIINR